MSAATHKTVAEHETRHLSLGKYVGGFFASLVLTVTAYVLATRGTADKNVLVALLAGLAIVQFLVQMVFFLHVGEERKPRWKLMVMWLMLAVVLILVGGSIWIMNNLNYRMMASPQQQEQYLRSQDSL
jgi:cytochrome o ubiquinol oxidase operon protein cyoD